MIKVKSAVDEPMVMVPVVIEQVGWAVTLAVGKAGVVGWGATVKSVAVPVHPLVFLEVRGYVPGARPVKMPFELV